jgi:RNA polymerase sigma factor (sigma-70 family)
MEASAAAVPAGVRRSARLLRLASDERLVALVRAGDEAAFEALYDRHHAAILGFCRHMLGTREEAEDALQHTFLAAFRDLVGSAKPIELRPWLFTIARNRCLSLLRMRRPQVALELAEPATDRLAATVERREDVRELLTDLARLPEDQRAALLLTELGALDHAGVAAVLGCPREKVKALVFQARSSLALSRQARETSCEEIREQLATLRGGALRRTALRRHLRGCVGCREYRDEVRRQRSAMAVLLPVVPAAGLKKAVLAGAGLSGGGAGAGAGAGGIGVAGAKLAVLKGVAAVAIVGAGAAGGTAVVQQIDSGSGTPRHAAPAASHGNEAAAGRDGFGVSSVAASAAAGSVSATAHGRVAGGSSAAHSNRAAAHQNALAHGRGLKRGLLGTQPGHNQTSTSSPGVGRGNGSGSGQSHSNAQGNAYGQNGTSSPGRSTFVPRSNSKAATPAVPGTTGLSTRRGLSSD